MFPPADDPPDLAIPPNRGPLPVRRNPNPNPNPRAPSGHQRDPRPQGIRVARAHRGARRGSFCTMWRFLSGSIAFSVLFIVFLMVMQTKIRVPEQGWSFLDGIKSGKSLKFGQGSLLRRFGQRNGLDHLRSEMRIGVRRPRLALILGNMKKNPPSLMLFTVIKNLQGLGYLFKIYAVDDDNSRSIWEQLGGQISILSPEIYSHNDWTTFEGIIVDSLEAKEAILSLMQEPFCFIPLIWIIQEDTLAKRLPFYEKLGWEHLVSYWRSAFSRADVVVFPDFSLPMLYSVLDTGNFFVIPASPVDVWAAESYSKTHSKYQLREDLGFNKDDMLVLVVGSSFFYDELSWDYAVAMNDIGPLLSKYARSKNAGAMLRFVFLCGNSTDGYNDHLKVYGYNDHLKEVASHLKLLPGSVRQYGMNSDVNGLMLMADVVIYASSQVEQGFPPLLTRAMSFGIPVIAPDLPDIRKYVVDGVHVVIFPKNNPDALMRAFSLLISNGKLSKFAKAVALSGRLLAKNMLASECVNSYAKLLENVLSFPSDVLLPGHISQSQHDAWEWNSFRTADMPLIENGSASMRKSSVVDVLEETLSNQLDSGNISNSETENDVLTQLDWDVLREIESIEEMERLEMEELEERMEKNPGIWDEIYRNARKVERVKFEANERDEGELERTGQPLCIYEIYNGAGAWPFLHHGSMYRGLSLTTSARRLRSDDVDAVDRLPVLNDTYYRDIFCDIGGMFSIAFRVDKIHKRPWIGFQSWHAVGSKVSLSSRAEKVLEETIQEETKGDVLYFWAHLNVDDGPTQKNRIPTFWSMCDILNGGNCRTAFEDAFRQMYAMPSYIEALPPMPEDGGYWSALHSWVMPTPSFLEFIMFSRMFADSLDALHMNSRQSMNLSQSMNSSQPTVCLLGSSKLEKKHCYCRVLELLVNVWAYHSARKMVYINPYSGQLEEQHPVEQRRGFMWAKYFNSTLLKSMDEDLAEAADDGDHPRERWLWPLTGEVHWQGIYEREREERYRSKMDKKRKAKEKLVERMKHGYKQKPIGR